MILCDKYIRENRIITPCEKRTIFRGMSYGLSSCGYDVRVDLGDIKRWSNCEIVQTPDGDGIRIKPGTSALVGIMEHFSIPLNVVGFARNKSTWARLGMFVDQAVLEPGWKGYLSLRVANLGDGPLTIVNGEPIAQILFQWIDAQPEKSYSGKYQGQGRGPQGARFDEDDGE